jgi:hypothetical protein
MRMTCDCGQILDQHTCFVLESIDDSGKEQTLTVVCKDCAKRNAAKLATIAKHDEPQGIQYRWQTWAKTIPIEPLKNVEFVHVGEPAKPKKAQKPRIPSINQIVCGKDQSERFKPLAIAILEKHGIVLNAGTMIIAGQPCNPSAIVADDIADRVAMWAKRCREIIGEPIEDSEELGIGDFVTINEKQCRRMIGKKTREHIATVDETLRRTAEKHGNVYRWFRSAAIADRETNTPNSIIGVNTAGERVAVISCVIDAE